MKATTWGLMFNRYKALGCDPSDAAFRADQWEKRQRPATPERPTPMQIGSDVKRDREASLKICADMAWELGTRDAFDSTITMARQMGHTDGFKEGTAYVLAQLATRTDSQP